MGEWKVSHKGSNTEAPHVPELDIQGAANVTTRAAKLLLSVSRVL